MRNGRGGGSGGVGGVVEAAGGTIESAAGKIGALIVAGFVGVIGIGRRGERSREERNLAIARVLIK